jgi:hypothetical protein
MATTALIPSRYFDFGPDDVGVNEVVTFDSVISEAHEFEIAIVDDPVETGVSLSDHAYAKPRELQMEVAVSDTPLLRDDAGTPSARLATTWVNGGSSTTRRSVVAWEYIVRKAGEFAIFDVQTGLELYRNIMFKKGSARTEKDTAGCLRATIGLKQVTFASTRTATYPPRGPKKTKRAAAPKVDEGKKEADNAEQTEEMRSALVKIGLPGG